MAIDRFLRFRDLKARGLLNNHVTMGRWIKYEGFPPGMMLGPNTRVWRESEIEAWLASRSTKNDRQYGLADQIDALPDRMDADALGAWCDRRGVTANVSGGTE